MNIIKVRNKRKLCVKLMKLDQTDNVWIFKFGEPYYRFIQTIIFPKHCGWEDALEMWEMVHVKFLERAKELEWLRS